MLHLLGLLHFVLDRKHLGDFTLSTLCDFLYVGRWARRAHRPRRRLAARRLRPPIALVRIMSR